MQPQCRRVTAPLAWLRDVHCEFCRIRRFTRDAETVDGRAVPEARNWRALLKRAVAWPGDGVAADAYLREGVTLFAAEIHPTDQGHGLSALKEPLAWRDNRG
jgi:hypothetical protein